MTLKHTDDTMASDQIKITLPNGEVLELPYGSTSGEVAAGIGPGLAKAAIAAVTAAPSSADAATSFLGLTRSASVVIAERRAPATNPS